MKNLVRIWILVYIPNYILWLSEISHIPNTQNITIIFYQVILKILLNAHFLHNYYKQGPQSCQPFLYLKTNLTIWLLQ